VARLASTKEQTHAGVAGRDQTDHHEATFLRWACSSATFFGFEERGKEWDLSPFCKEFGTKRTCSLRSKTFCLLGNESQK
jgi:hypothetical protein